MFSDVRVSNRVVHVRKNGRTRDENQNLKKIRADRLGLTTAADVSRTKASLVTRQPVVTYSLVCRHLSYRYEDIVVGHGDCLLHRSELYRELESFCVLTFGGPVVPDEKHRKATRCLLSPGPNRLGFKDLVRPDLRADSMIPSKVANCVPAFDDPNKTTSIADWSSSRVTASLMFLTDAGWATISLGWEIRN